MTTLAQGDLPKDIEVLRTLVRHNRVDVAGGLYPCAGVYAVVEASGRPEPATACPPPDASRRFRRVRHSNVTSPR